MAINGLWHLSALGLNRRLSVLSRKRSVQCWTSGIKSEKQIYRECGLSRNVLWELHRWYWRSFVLPHFSPSKHTIMRSKEKALLKRINKLEKEKVSLRRRSNGNAFAHRPSRR